MRSRVSRVIYRFNELSSTRMIDCVALARCFLCCFALLRVALLLSQPFLSSPSRRKRSFFPAGKGFSSLCHPGSCYGHCVFWCVSRASKALLPSSLSFARSCPPLARSGNRSGKNVMNAGNGGPERRSKSDQIELFTVHYSINFENSFNGRLALRIRHTHPQHEQEPPRVWVMDGQRKAFQFNFLAFCPMRKSSFEIVLGNETESKSACRSCRLVQLYVYHVVHVVWGINQ